MQFPIPTNTIEFNPKLSFFEGVSKMLEPKTLDEAFEIMQNNIIHKEMIEAIRSESDKEKRGILKKKLRGVTFSGLFEKSRTKKHLKEYTHIVCHDLDNLEAEEVERLQKELAADEYIYSFFVSPSGNGLKILFRTETDQKEHTNCFNAIGSYLVNKYAIVFDEKCKDITRLCFLSYDENFYLNRDAKFITADFVNSWQPAKYEAQTFGTQQYIDKCHEITQKTKQAAPGSYNSYITTFAIFANRYGIDVNSCIAELQSYCSAHDQKETEASVKSTYNTFSNEHGNWLKTSHFIPSKKAAREQISEYATLPIDENNIDSSILFWYEVENEKTKRKEFRFSYDDAITFLQNNGFYKYPLDNGYYQFIHVDKKNKTVKVVQTLQIKEFMINFLKLHDGEPEIKKVREMFRRGAKNYCSINLLEGLDYFKPDFKKDTKNNAFVYFKNCYLEVSKEGINKKEYSTMTGYVWDKQVMSLDYEKKAEIGDFERFVFYAIIGRKEDETNPYNKEELQKILSASSTIGYLLHRYKNPAITKAVIAVDKQLRRTGEQNGRSGKSLFSKGIKEMMNVCTIDGRNFKFDAPFPFQRADIDTEIVDFNDVQNNFDFSRLFGMITEEFTFEKKGKDSITLSFSDAPKFYISTNYTLRGDGESNKGRQQIIEFAPYFNTTHTPLKEFGKMFFYDWDKTEWLYFYNFMIECLQTYFEFGLIPFPLEHYEENKLIDAAGQEFIDYMNETVLEQMAIDGEIYRDAERESKQLYLQYCENNPHRAKTHIKTFNKNVKAWADLNKLAINAHKGGDRDRRNGIDYITFSKNYIQ